MVLIAAKATIQLTWDKAKSGSISCLYVASSIVNGSAGWNDPLSQAFLVCTWSLILLSPYRKRGSRCAWSICSDLATCWKYARAAPIDIAGTHVVSRQYYKTDKPALCSRGLREGKVLTSNHAQDDIRRTNRGLSMTLDCCFMCLP